MKVISYLFLAFILFTLVNCSAASRTTTAENASTNAPSVSNSATANTTPVAENQTQTIAPDALVRDLYDQQKKDKGPFFQTKNRALVDKYFDKNLADLIWKDAKEANGEVGALDADPLYNAQDTDIKKFSIGQAKITGERAEVPVTFENFGEKKSFIFMLVQQNSDWKISDIKYGGGSTLTGIFKDNAQNTNDKNGEFEGAYQVGETTCTVKPIKMAFEVKWAKGTGAEIFFSQDRANDKYIFASDPKTGKANVFSFDDENYNTGTFYRADGKEFPIERVK
ncbi:MAG: DUF3828 domain-containing protein [Pyrinomonadaceae bacterium]